MAEAILHVYDVTNSGNSGTKDAIIQINEVFKDGVVQGGVFHSAVQVYGNEEWSFRFCDQGSGVFSCPSTKNPMYTFRQSIKLGSTSLTISKINKIIQELSEEWHGHSYDLVSKNSSHFCDEFCDRLGVPKQQLPLKKRRHLLRPTSPQDPLSLENKDKIPVRSLYSVPKSLSSFPDLQSSGIDEQFVDGFREEFNREVLPNKEKTGLSVEGSLSGLELLAAAAAAAAASMDIDSDNPIKVGCVIEDSSILRDVDAFGPKCDESDNAVVHAEVIGCSQGLNNTSDASQGLLCPIEDRNRPEHTLKVDRRHWDLNTVMDSWDKPHDDSNYVHISMDYADGVMHVNGKDEHHDDEPAVLNSNITGVETPNGKIEEMKLKAVSTSGTFFNFPNHMDCLQEPNDNIYSNVGYESSAEATKKVVDFPTTSLSSIVDGEKSESPITLIEKINLLVHASQDVDMFLDGHGRTVDGTEIIECAEGRDSPYEDGELRGSCLYSLEDYELDEDCVDYESNARNDCSDAADLHGCEIVCGTSEGSHDSDRKNLVKGFSGNKSDHRVTEQTNRRNIKKATSNKGEICGKNASNEESVTCENEEGSKGRSVAISGVVDKVTQIDECMLKKRWVKLQSATSCSSLDATDENDVFLMQRCRSHNLRGPESCSERDAFSEKYLNKFRPAHFSERDGADWWTNGGSRSHYSSAAYQRVEGRIDSVDKFGRVSIPGKSRAAHHSSKRFHGTLSRSPDNREDCFGQPRRVSGARHGGRCMRGYYSRIASRDFGQNFDSLADDTSNTIRMSPYKSRRERSFSPSSDKSCHVSSTRSRSPSKFKTRSPIPWHSLVERNLSSRKHIIRSRDFRSEARDDRLPISKPKFTSDCREGSYFSPPRGRGSHDRDDRWSDSHNFENSHIKTRKSPGRVFRSTRRRDTVTSSHLKSDEFYRPTTQSRRFSFVSYNDRGSKFENYEKRKHESSGDMMHRGRYVRDGGSLRQFRHTKLENDFETSNSNDYDVLRTYPKDVPQRWERKR